MADKELQEWLAERAQKRRLREERRTDLFRQILSAKKEIAMLPSREKNRRQKLRRRLRRLERERNKLLPAHRVTRIKHHRYALCRLPSKSVFGQLPNSRKVAV